MRYDPATAAGYARHLRAQGLPAARIVVQTLLHRGLRRGDAATVDPTLASLLDRPPRAIADYISDHLALWSRDTVVAPPQRSEGSRRV